MSRVLVDARWMFGRLRGMGRFAWQVIAPIEHQCVLATSAAAEQTSVQTIKKGSSFFPLWEQKTLPLIADAGSVKWLLCPYNTAPLRESSARLILVVHDLIFMEPWLELPPSISMYQNLGRIYRRFIVPRAIKKADFLVTVSEYTKQLIVERYGVEADDVAVIPNALDASWFALTAPKLELRENYVLTVAGEAPSKNLQRLLKAFALYVHKVNSVFELKVVGVSQAQHEVFLKICRQLRIAHRVRFEGYIGDSELKALYTRARAFIFPSLYEGFGIPLLEAMAAGTPIVCSNTTSLPEVVGDAALLFNPRDIDEMADSIRRVLEDSSLASRLVTNGLEQVKKFSVERITQRTECFWQRLGFDLDGK